MTTPLFTRRQLLGYGAASLAFATRPSWALDKKTDVLILGAGISGLHAARMLLKQGLSVTVLEGSGRVGGRCWTARDVPGQPEFGASSVGGGYGRVRGNAAELNVELIIPPPGSRDAIGSANQAYSVNGSVVSSIPWANSPLNRLAENEKAFSPLQIYSRLVNTKTKLVELTDWLKPEFAHLDNMSLRQYFVSLGASAEALRLMDVQCPAANLDDANALHFIRRNVFYAFEGRAGAAHKVKGGMSSLTDAMAASLTKPVLLNKNVKRIQADAKQVTVQCSDGSTYKARTCISTIPLSVMKNIRVDGNVSAKHRAAWKAMRYTDVVLVYMTVKSPFWERDGASADMWTDGGFERIFHLPSETDPNGILNAYISGDGLKPLNAMTDAAIGQFVIDELARLRPASKGEVSVSHVHNWARYPFNLGHIAYPAPGDIGRYESMLHQPVGGLYFAGDHCGRVHVGLEAACESAENAAIKILDSIA